MSKIALRTVAPLAEKVQTAQLDKDFGQAKDGVRLVGWSNPGGIVGEGRLIKVLQT